MMNLILEICYTQKDLYERQDMKKEVKKLEKIIKQAKKYRDDLNDLINIDFNNPNEKLINLSKKEGFDLKDKNIQKYFNDLKIKLINEINEFHESNLKLIKSQNNKDITKLNELKEKYNIKDENYFNEDDDSGNKKNKINEESMFNKDKFNNIYKRNNNSDNSLKNKNINKNEKNKENKNSKKNNQIIMNNNEQLKNTLKLAFSGIFVFLCFYLLKFGLGYYLRNKLDIDI